MWCAVLSFFWTPLIRWEILGKVLLDKKDPKLLDQPFVAEHHRYLACLTRYKVKDKKLAAGTSRTWDTRRVIIYRRIRIIQENTTEFCKESRLWAGVWTEKKWTSCGQEKNKINFRSGNPSSSSSRLEIPCAMAFTSSHDENNGGIFTMIFMMMVFIMKKWWYLPWKWWYLPWKWW